MTTRAPLVTWFIRLGILSLVLLPVGPLATRAGLIHYSLGLLLLACSMLLALVVAAAGAWSIWPSTSEPNRRGLWLASALALPALLVAALAITSGRGAPPIHDITTNPDDPPAFVAAVAARGEDSNSLEYTAEKAAAQREAYPDLQPIEVPLDFTAAYALALHTADAIGWEILEDAPDQLRIEAVDTTFWFRFRDDIVIRIRPQGERGVEAETTIVDLRSVSRVGVGDLGANARRIREFREAFLEAVAREPSFQGAAE